MPSRLASDRPIKNVIGSVNQAPLRCGGGQARGWAEAAGWLDNRSRLEERERGRGRKQCHTHTVPSLHTSQRHSARAYRGVQLLCFVVCLYQGRGGDNLSLFVGISGSVMWL